MAFADSVPGVSGGTICYIMNLYDELFDSIINLKLYKTDREKFNTALSFIIKIIIGWIIGVLVAVNVITTVMENNIYFLTSMFIGFILIAIPVTFSQEIDVYKSNLKDSYYTLIGAIIVILLTFLGSTSTINISSEPSVTGYIYIFITGFLAISCMLLPGISGSTVAIIMGVYYLVMDSIHAFISLDFSVTPILLAFGFGVLFGIVFAINFIKMLLNRYRSKILYLIQGLMIGSLYAIIMGPTTAQDASGNIIGYDALNFTNLSIYGLVFGCILIILLNGLANRSTKS